MIGQLDTTRDPIAAGRQRLERPSETIAIDKLDAW